MALRRENLSTLVKRHVRLKQQLNALDKERDKLITEKQAIYNHLTSAKQNNGRGLTGGGLRYGLIDGVRVAVRAVNGNVEITDLDFNDFDEFSPAADGQD